MQATFHYSSPATQKTYDAPNATRPSRVFEYSDLQERGSEMIGTKRSSRRRNSPAPSFLSLAILVWSGCGGGMNVGDSSSTSNGVKITPARHDGARRRHHTVLGHRSREMRTRAVTWSVNGVADRQRDRRHHRLEGNVSGAREPPHAEHGEVEAVSIADKTLTATTSVTLQNPIPVPQIVSPTLLPVGNFTVTVGGSNFVSGSKVMFGGTALATTVCQRQPTHRRREPPPQAQVGTVKITVENPDPGKSDSAAFLNVQVGAAGKVSVSGDSSHGSDCSWALFSTIGPR